MSNGVSPADLVSIETKPALPCIGCDNGVYYIHGARCANCGQDFAGPRDVCARCGSRGSLDARRYADRGVLHSYTVVHRSYPGIPTPFVMAVVDLVDGPTLRGTLVGTTCDPATIPFGQDVRVIFQRTSQVDADGKPFVVYAFEPMEQVQ